MQKSYSEIQKEMYVKLDDVIYKTGIEAEQLCIIMPFCYINEILHMDFRNSIDNISSKHYRYLDGFKIIPADVDEIYIGFDM